MTDKKEKIITAALTLFANNGFNAVSTSKIAKSAGVSEGLIFRHFGNKKGLLNAIMEDTEVKINQGFAPVLFETDPLKTIEKLIKAPFHIDKSEYSFWRLQFKLKWEKEFHNPNKMKPLVDKLIWAFTELGYKKPEMEAGVLIKIINYTSIEILREGPESQKKYETFLIQKYKI